MTTVDEVFCQVCGVSSSKRALTITFSHQQTDIFCELCGGLVESGLLRPETVDGEIRYRQWHPQPMAPGRLLPRPTTDGASA